VGGCRAVETWRPASRSRSAFAGWDQSARLRTDYKRVFTQRRKEDAKIDHKISFAFASFFAPLRETSYFLSASISTRPVELLGGVMRSSADNVGAMSAGDAASRVLPGINARAHDDRRHVRVVRVR
jgi:hypothetical protein